MNTFGELAVTCTPPPPPPSEWSILTRIPYIFPVFTPKFDRLVWLQYACPCHPNYRVGRYGNVAYTKDMELLTLSVLYIQGSDAGQKYFKI